MMRPRFSLALACLTLAGCCDPLEPPNEMIRARNTYRRVAIEGIRDMKLWTVTYDGCEYVIGVNSIESSSITHKCNCIYCLKRAMVKTVGEQHAEEPTP
jgi:hypothetical protein